MAVVRHCLNANGKAAKRAGESEDLSELKGVTTVDWGAPQDLEDKKGKSPDRFNSVRVFF